MAGEIHVNNIGTVFKLTIVDQDENIVDVSDATTLTIYIKKPEGNALTKTASLYTDGTDGIVKYSSVSGDLDVPGVYQIQAYVVVDGSHFYSDIKSFNVYRNLI